MKLPVLLPESLNHYGQIDDDQELFESLKRSPGDMLEFLEYGSRDDYWAQGHRRFFERTFDWLSNEFFQRRIPDRIALRCGALLRSENDALISLIPRDLTVAAAGISMTVNALLFATISPAFFELVKNLSAKGVKKLALEEGSSASLEATIEYASRGRVEHLWRKEMNEVMAILEDADVWEIPGLIEFCSELLKRYINKSNVVTLLLRAHKRNWFLLRGACAAFINEMATGADLSVNNGPLSLRYRFFSDEGIDLFDKIKKAVTQLGFDGALPEESEFSELLSRSRGLTGVDISRTSSFTERFRDLPPILQELDLSMCGWLGERELEFLCRQCPELVVLKLNSNSQLNFRSLGMLQQWRRLKRLELARCHQLKDDDIALICKLRPALVALDIEEGGAITDNAMKAIGEWLREIEELNISRTAITDIGLIDVVYRCRSLRELILTRCPNITDRGIREVAFKSPQLRLLVITHTSYSNRLLAEIRASKPALTIVIE